MQSPFAPIQGLKGLSGVGSISPIMSPTTSSVSAPTAENAKSFGNMLGEALSNVNTTLDVAKQSTDGLLDGSMENIHEMSIAGAKAEVMLHLTTQIASKLSSATTTLFQMQL